MHHDLLVVKTSIMTSQKQNKCSVEV